MTCFVINPNPTFTEHVTVTLPNGEEQSLTVTFKALSISTTEKLIKSSAIEFAREIVIDWQDVVDDQGEPVPFSKTMLDQLLDLDWFSAAVVNTYSETLQSRGQRILKKSQRH